MFSWLKKLFNPFYNSHTVEIKIHNDDVKITENGKVVYKGSVSDIPAKYQKTLADTDRAFACMDREFSRIFNNKG